ncbi:MAG: AbrB/MazE/SpoVT family DNA-binding domain-containing protein [Phycisphaerales bacterium]
MVTRVQKWGNGLVLRIPKSLADEVGLKDNSPVGLSLWQGKLIVTPVAKPDAALDNLLARVTKENLHGEVNAGHARGRETW